MPYYLYLSLAGDNKISIFTMNPETGELDNRQDVALEGGPSPLAVDPTTTYLYAGLRGNRNIASFRINQATGNLSLIGAVPLDADPCYLSTDRKGKFLLSAYYGAGKAAVHRIGANGAAEGSPVASQDTAGHAHCIQTDPSNKFVFVPHTVPANAIFQFRFDGNTGALTPNAVPTVAGGEGQGPRHYCYHPSKDIVYASNENGSSVSAYHLDTSAGTLNAFQTLSTLPQGCTEDNTTAQIHIAPSGKSLYVSNRGHDSIACFSIDNATGELTAIGQQPTEQTPRVFNIDPTGNFLFAGGLGSGKLAAYRIDAQTGKLTPLKTYEVGQRPMWVLIVKL